MEFRVLSHACLLVKTERHSIVIDPWLVGSCYWRSWWNFPSAQFDPEELAEVDAVVISHVHWDHWHGPTLKKLLKGKTVIVPDEPSQRSRRDLDSIGFKDVKAVPHGQTVEVGDIKITLHQFGLFLNDAAVVVEADGVTLLDANDAKIAGMSLSNVLARHPKVDFAFRSHSSANPRICFGVTDEEEDYVADDREHYFRSFVSFMDVVRPTYAVPFASNHCHLHDDVFAMNSYISNPLELRSYVTAQDQKRPWSLQVMLPGSSWSSQGGFELAAETPFENLDATLRAYRERVAPTLEKYETQENKVKIGDLVLRRFQTMLSAKRGKWSSKVRFAVTARWPDGRLATWKVEPAAQTIEPIEPISEPQPGLPLIVMPAIVFRDAVLSNMFHHAGISKRCRFTAVNTHDLNTLKSVFAHLEKVELGVLPLTRSYVRGMAGAYSRRWRELFVYAQGFWHMKIRRRPIYLAEEAILRSTGR
jgi:UDP-MurNAc hydroxylase